MKRLASLMVFLFTLAAIASPAGAWHGVEFSTYYQAPFLHDLVLEDGAVIYAASGVTAAGDTVATIASDGTITWGQAQTFSGNLVVSGDLWVDGADIWLKDATYRGMKINGNANTFRFYTPTNPSSLGSHLSMTISSSTVTFADGITMYAGDKTDATIVYDYSDDDIDINKKITTANVTKWIWVPATSMKLPSSAPATAAQTGSVGVLEFANSAADDHAWFSVIVPDDYVASTDMEMYYVYTPAAGAPEQEGQWGANVGAISDGGTVAAAGTALEFVYDTPQSGAKWNVTTSATIPNASLTAGNMLNVDVYHDVSDPFANNPQLLGVYIAYTANKLGQ